MDRSVGVEDKPQGSVVKVSKVKVMNMELVTWVDRFGSGGAGGITGAAPVGASSA